MYLQIQSLEFRKGVVTNLSSKLHQVIFIVGVLEIKAINFDFDYLNPKRSILSWYSFKISVIAILKKKQNNLG